MDTVQLSGTFVCIFFVWLTNVPYARSNATFPQLDVTSVFLAPCDNVEVGNLARPIPKCIAHWIHDDRELINSTLHASPYLLLQPAP